MSSTTQNYRLDYDNDVAGVIGYAVRLFDGRIKIGFGSKILNRVEIHKDIPSTSTNLQWKNLVAEGGGISGIGGIILSAPWKFLPTIAATVKDIGTTSFNLNNGYFYQTNVQPQSIPTTVDVGASIFPIHSNSVRSAISVEYRDVSTYGSETDQSRRYHAGVEVDFGDLFFLRGGMNQRYYTAGVEIDIKFVQFQFATYGEEIGTPDAHLEDRRYEGKISLRF